MTYLSRKRHARTRLSLVAVLRPVAAVVALIALIAGGALAWVIGIASSEPSLVDVRPIHQPSGSVVLAADGSRLGYLPSDIAREPVAGDRLPESLRDATVAIEDRNFWRHGALDYGAIARAAVANLTAGKVVEGGSTIAQQLVKLLYIRDPADTLERKIREAKFATELVDRHTRGWILNRYLNSVPYGTVGGRTALGAQAASRIYFSRDASELDLRRAALLAGLPQAPSAYDPFEHPGRALERRAEVLDAMRAQGYITAAEEERAGSLGLGLDRGHRYDSVRDPYIVDMVRRQLTRRYGRDLIRRGGLEIHTTIEPGLQAVAQQAVDDGAAVLYGPSAALAAVEAGTGHVLAMASSTDYSTDQFNLAADGRRQPGSAFKPFVLATALDRGIDPDSTYYDGSSPVALQPYPGETWTVNNAEPGQGTMSVTDATTNSVNAVYAQLDLDVGPANVAKMAHRLGISSPLDGYPAEGIGGLRIGVSPLAMAAAYATFADGGVRHQPTAIDRVVVHSSTGKPVRTLTTGAERGKRAIPGGLAAKETEILKTVIQSGTGTAADIGCPAAGKTGTTDSQTDAWFVGYTPRIATAVWTGYPDARTSMGSSAFGGTYAAPIWNRFMSYARGDFCGDFPAPAAPLELDSYEGGHSASGTRGGTGYGH